MTQNENILTVNNLAVRFANSFEPIKEVDLTICTGEVLGLVGESGSGKSMTALSIIGLLPHGAEQKKGTIIFQGSDLNLLSPQKRRSLCGRNIGMVFQEPLTALNPVLSIGEQVAEIYRYQGGFTRNQAWRKAIELLGQVGLPNPEDAAKSYPHRFSGGMRQRVIIAIALALNPELIIADEPTTALDPTIAMQIINLLKTMTEERKTSVLFITHNLRLLANLATRVMVMYAGIIVEELGANFDTPLHPYTKGLVNALPPPPSEKKCSRLASIPGQTPGPKENLPGCPFAPRCPERFDPCEKTIPPMIHLASNRMVRCFRGNHA
jgi:oligopeptide transport system ATP-binding protein